MVGQTVSHYQILEKLGEGGMGVVYKARDTRLNRLVAIKVLPPERTADLERKHRFIQEARAASALNHPNIITIYEIDQHQGADFIAMEYVPGKTLDQIVPRKGLRPDDALKYAVQMADALAAAHAAGIVHRDLKPGNLMVNEQGRVKVLDFGLAKLTEAQHVNEDTPTQIYRPTTEEGAILGTVAYMSPEQARGKKVDARSDVFSFGSVLYEMVTGRRAFHGDSNPTTLAAIIEKEPAPLAADVPHDLEKLITRCMRKDPDRRFQHMDDVKIALEELKEESDSGKLARDANPRTGVSRRKLALVGAGLLAIISAASLLWRSLSYGPPPPVKVVPLTSYPGIESEPSLSPDGNSVAFVWNGEKQDNFDIYLLGLGGGNPLRLTRHEAAEFSPAFSPDGARIAFLREFPEGRSGVYLIPALGGAERMLGEVKARFEHGYFMRRRRLNWTPDGKWLAVRDGTPLVLLSVEGGERRKLTSAIPGKGQADPAFSPDGRMLAFSALEAHSRNYLRLLELGKDYSPKGEPVGLVPDDRIAASPVWTPDGRELVFVWGHFGSLNLFKVNFRGTAKPQPITSSEEWATNPTLSRQQGRLVFARMLLAAGIWRIDLSGRDGQVAAPVKHISSTRLDFAPAYSPDKRHIAFVSTRTGSSEIWICETDGTNPQPLTSFGGALVGRPRWSPDGSQICFDAYPEGLPDIYVMNANGGRPRRITSNPGWDLAPTWSRDGKWVYFCSLRSDQSGPQVWKLSRNDNREIQITKQGGFCAYESADGRYLYYSKDGQTPSSLWRVPVEGGEERQVLDVFEGICFFAVTSNGIYYIRPTSDVDKHLVQFLSFSTGKSTSLATLDRLPVSGPDVSPDGRSILYSQTDRWDSDLMLVENFR